MTMQAHSHPGLACLVPYSWNNTIWAGRRANDMLHLIAGEFSTLGNGVLDVGRALVDLIQEIINVGTPGHNSPGGGGGQYPFG